MARMARVVVPGYPHHVTQRGNRSFGMDEQYLLATVRYVENNPVAARLCENPGL
jgi:putative transposase